MLGVSATKVIDLLLFLNGKIVSFRVMTLPAKATRQKDCRVGHIKNLHARLPDVFSPNIKRKFCTYIGKHS